MVRQSIALASFAAGTTVLPQFSAVYFDPEHFVEPFAFRPDRYIDDPTLADRVLVFGMGRRACMGESLARMELFLVLVTWVQHFQLELIREPNVDYMKPSGASNLIRLPHDYTCKISER